MFCTLMTFPRSMLDLRPKCMVSPTRRPSTAGTNETEPSSKRIFAKGASRPRSCTRSITWPSWVSASGKLG